MRTRNFEIFQKIAIMSKDDTMPLPNMVALNDTIVTSCYASLGSYKGRFILTQIANTATYGTVASSGDCCIWVGTSDTPNTEVAGKNYCSDNKLIAPCSTSDITSNSFTVSNPPVWSGDEIGRTYTRTFTANVDLVIKEIGFIKSMENQYLLDRTVLAQEDWITVAAGNQFTITMVIGG